jgi:hypothetical protein
MNKKLKVLQIDGDKGRELSTSEVADLLFEMAGVR